MKGDAPKAIERISWLSVFLILFFFFLLYDLLSLRKFQDFEMCFGTADTVHVYNIEKVDVFFIFLTAEN